MVSSATKTCHQFTFSGRSAFKQIEVAAMTWTKSAQMGWGLATCKAGTIGEGLRFLVTQFSGIRSHTWQLYLVYPRSCGKVDRPGGRHIATPQYHEAQLGESMFVYEALCRSPKCPNSYTPPLQTHSKTLRILAEVS